MRIPACDQTGIEHLDRWIQEVRKRISTEDLREMFFGWVDDGHTTMLLGKLPAFSYILNVHVHVVEAFNSDAADTLTVGWTADTDALVTALDVSTTGVKSPTLGANNGYNSSEQEVNAYYTAGGSAATTGKAIVLVEFVRVTQAVA